jgi:glutathionylspermidine synthase
VEEPWQPAEPLTLRDYREIRRRAIFECCKWDPQVGDVASLAEFPIVLTEKTWRELSRDAEALYHETLALERAATEALQVHQTLGLPRPVRRALAAAEGAGAPQGFARVMRFDFHCTTEGWRISEVNSDVPGGFIEASGFTTLVAEHYPDLAMPGDPAQALVRRVVQAVGDGAAIALVHATAFTDDRQVMVYLARMLETQGVRTCLASPADLWWYDGQAHLATTRPAGALAGLLRFYPAEWLPNLPSSCGWRHFFAGGRTPQSNPGTALLTQSKRLPLVWEELGVAIPAWRRLLPETRAAGRTNWRVNGEWVLKPALGRVGDAVGLCGITRPDQWRQIARGVRWFGSHWIAQRRFEAVAMSAPGGCVYPCVGVFVIDGHAAGAYGRVARRPLIDEQAQDAAVLIAAERACARKSAGRLATHAEAGAL